jgi:pimeloyl-ACP methyl ester carboxylesterase
MGQSKIPWNHQYIQANGIRIHYVRHGKGFPILLLHGWPEFWFVYRKNILPLAESFDVIAPDLRGFGQTEKPVLPDPPSCLVQTLVDDLHALADGLGFKQFGIVSHDVAANSVQVYARQHPERIRGPLFSTARIRGSGSVGPKPIRSMRSGISLFISNHGLPSSWAITGIPVASTLPI